MPLRMAVDSRANDRRSKNMVPLNSRAVPKTNLNHTRAHRESVCDNTRCLNSLILIYDPRQSARLCWSRYLRKFHSKINVWGGHIVSQVGLKFHSLYQLMDALRWNCLSLSIKSAASRLDLIHSWTNLNRPRNTSSIQKTQRFAN